MPITHRIAMTLSGGLSLGAYEGGVLAQLYRDLNTINARENGPRIVIDAFSGASAGSITSLLMTRALTTNDSPDVLEGRLWDAWVNRADVGSFLQPANGPEESVFTQNTINSIAAADVPLPVEATGAETNLSRAIALWMSVTNLDGIPLELVFPIRGQTRPVTMFASTYKDYDPYLVVGSDVRRVNVKTEILGTDICSTNLLNDCPVVGWQPAIHTAIMSGSFPVAFKSQPLERDLKLYEGYAGTGKQGWPTRVTFQAVDGGILGNEPIGRVIDAVSFLNKLDPARSGDQRTYLIIDPNPSSEESVLQALNQVQARHATGSDKNGIFIENVLPMILNAYFNTAFSSDFMTVLAVNRQLDAVEHISGLTDGQKRDLLSAMGLDTKVQIALERIPHQIPTADRLASDFLNDFGGFTQKRFRAFDFYVGRMEARDWLVDWLTRNSTELLKAAPAGLIAAISSYTPAPYTGQHGPKQGPAGKYVDFSDASWCRHMTDNQRKTIVNTVIDRLEQLAFRDFRLKWVTRQILKLLRRAMNSVIAKKLVHCCPSDGPKPAKK